jgi:methylisocitrate lyase
VTLEQALAHLTALADAVDVPVSADFEGGFAVEPEVVRANVARALETGIAGLSVEDSKKDGAGLLDFGLSLERVRAAKAAFDAVSDGQGVLTARSEGFVAGQPDLAETIKRLTAYAEAGADCLFAPGIRDKADIAAIVKAVAPKPVNVLVTSDFTNVAEMTDLGVRRISVGGALARAAWAGFFAAATEIAEKGTFTQVARAFPSSELDRKFA